MSSESTNKAKPTVSLETFTHKARNLVNTVATLSDGNAIIFHGYKLGDTRGAFSCAGYDISESSEREVSRREVLDHGAGLTECYAHTRHLVNFLDRVNSGKLKLAVARPR